MGGSLTMKNGKIDKYLFEGGYAQASVASSTTDNFAFYFYNQDHLGNIREVVDASGAVQQVTNYYPFGAPYADTSAATNPDFQPYKYNGKELDKMHGLNTYDYGARQHDPILARWDRIDPLCEKYYDISPYAYCHNNPIFLIDSDGRDDYYTRDGTYLGTNKAKTDNIYITDKGQYKKLGDSKNTVNIYSRVALNDTELDAEAYSKIFTNSLKLGGFDTSELAEGKIQITVWDTEGGSKVSRNYTNSASFNGEAIAITNGDSDNGAQITAFIWPLGTEERDLFSTRSNILSCVGDHEFSCHYKLGYKHKDNTPDPTFVEQKKSQNWNKTTKQFKNYINKTIKEHGYE